MQTTDERPGFGGAIMSSPKRMTKSTTDAREHPAARGARSAWRDPADDGHETPWDEPARDWGRGHSPLRELRKTFYREKFLGTW